MTQQVEEIQFFFNTFSFNGTYRTFFFHTLHMKKATSMTSISTRSPHLDEWFIGFFEGDGSFQQSRDLGLIVTQKETKILHLIQQHYQRGAVLQQKSDGSVSRFIARKQEDVKFFLKLMHNKLRLHHRRTQYDSFLQEFERRHGTFCLPHQKLQPLGDSAWLSGFVDAEGCFHARLGTKTYQQRIQFSLGQKYDKDILYQLRDVFNGGSVSKYTPASSFQYTLTGIKNMPPLITYFDRFPLQSKKALAYAKWKKIWVLLKQKYHLSRGFRPKLKKLMQDINVE